VNDILSFCFANPVFLPGSSPRIRGTKLERKARIELVEWLLAILRRKFTKQQADEMPQMKTISFNYPPPVSPPHKAASPEFALPENITQ